MSNKSISERLNLAIKSSGMSIRLIAENTNIPKSTIQRYISGQTEKMPITAVEAIANVLNIPACYLLGWENSEEPKPFQKQKNTATGHAMYDDFMNGPQKPKEEFTDDEIALIHKYRSLRNDSKGLLHAVMNYELAHERHKDGMTWEYKTPRLKKREQEVFGRMKDNAEDDPSEGQFGE